MKTTSRRKGIIQVETMFSSTTRPIGPEGLTWRDLHTWWGESNGFEGDEAKKSL